MWQWRTGAPEMGNKWDIGNKTMAAAYYLEKPLGCNANRGDTSRCHWFPWIRKHNWELRNSRWPEFTRQSASLTLDALFWNISFSINIQASTSSFIPVGIVPQNYLLGKPNYLQFSEHYFFSVFPVRIFHTAHCWIPCDTSDYLLNGQSLT